MLILKNIISKVAAVLSSLFLAVSPVVFADGVEDDISSGKYRNPFMTKSGSSGNIYDDTRYTDNAPFDYITDVFSQVGNGLFDTFIKCLQYQFDYVQNGGALIPDVGYIVTPEDWERFKNMDSDAFYESVHAQRIKDLVDYANQSTTGLTTGQNVVAFIAKRNLSLSFTNPGDNYEVDTMYYWRDFNHTGSNDLTGITIGNFYMRPNTIFVTRQFSNGDFKCFYADATQFDLRVTQSSANFVNSRFVLQFQSGKTYYINNPDGTTEQFTFNENSTAAANSSLRFLDLNGSTVNSTIEDDFARQAYYFPKFSEYITDGVLTNIQLMCNNASNSDGSMMRPNNYSGSADGWEKWFMSSGAFIDNGLNSLAGVTQTFTTNNYNFDPRKPPAVYNYDNRLTTNNYLTTDNVSNYSDYGISYNYITNQFDLDINALAAGLAAELVPQLQGNFDLVYDNQPDIGGSDWTNLSNNFNSDYDNLVIDIGDIISDLAPVPEGWQPPSYPAVNTSTYIPVYVPNYSTYMSVTVPDSVIEDAADFVSDGVDFMAVIGVLPFVIPLAIFGLLWKFTGGS